MIELKTLEELTSDPDTAESELKAWKKAVIEWNRDRCANCGIGDRLKVKMIVPLEAGGQLVTSNGVLLCRACEMASDSFSKSSKIENQRLVNFWISRKLFDRLRSALDTHQGFNSMGGLCRYLMAQFILDDTRFDDLQLYQDEGSDTKVNVWVDKDRYDTFKALLDKRGWTVTSVVKSLILMYLEIGNDRIAERAPVGVGDAE